MSYYVIGGGSNVSFDISVNRLLGDFSDSINPFNFYRGHRVQDAEVTKKLFCNLFAYYISHELSNKGYEIPSYTLEVDVEVTETDRDGEPHKIKISVDNRSMDECDEIIKQIVEEAFIYESTRDYPRSLSILLQ